MLSSEYIHQPKGDWVIRGRTRSLGGGVYIKDGGYVRNCVITECHAGSGGGVAIGGQGGRLEDCTISHNTANQQGGGIFAAGASVSILRCNIIGNSAGSRGNGIHGGGNLLIDQCIIHRNRSNRRGGNGGGVSLRGKGCILRNSLVTENNEPLYGGAITLSGGLVENCTITRNSCFGTRGGVLIYGEGRVVNSIVWGNTVFSELGDKGVLFEKCGLERASKGEGNRVVDPLFVDALRGDYRLQPGSPCIGTGATFQEQKKR